MVPAAATAAPVLPAAAPGDDVAGTVRLTAAWLSATPAAAGARQLGVCGLPASRAAAEERGSCCGGFAPRASPVRVPPMRLPQPGRRRSLFDHCGAGRALPRRGLPVRPPAGEPGRAAALVPGRVPDVTGAPAEEPAPCC